MAAPVKRMVLEEVLVKRRALTPEQAEAYAIEAEGTKRSFQQYLQEESLLPEDVLAQATAEQYGLKYEPLKDFRVDPEFFRSVPPEWMHQFRFVPLAEREGLLTIAIADPQNLKALDELEYLLGRELRLAVSTRTAIVESLKQTEGNSQVIARVQEEFRPILIQEDEHGDEVLSVEKIAQDQSPVVKLVDTIILNALQ
ncbi:MAG: pilus assembly protein PilB, partial [Nitrospirales bacterium]